MPPPSTGESHPSVEAFYTRDWRQQPVTTTGMAPTAFAFLVPVFIVAIATPLLVVWYIRKRQRRQLYVIPSPRPPILRRSEARERLDMVTAISVPVRESRIIENEKAVGLEQVEDVDSISERECAICLSELHAPSPPEPAKLSEGGVIDDSVESTSTIAIAPAEPETILKLQVCGHEFHAECLVSWVVLRKRSCPICRAEYYSKEAMIMHDIQADANEYPAPPPDQAVVPIPPRNWLRFVRRAFPRSRRVIHEHELRSAQQIP